jgi:hypothetical protein
MMIVPVIGGAAGVFPSDPVRAIRAVLSLPDGNALLHAVDHELARAERLTAVGRARHTDNGDFTDAKRPHPM